jgi:hypothetical protein
VRSPLAACDATDEGDLAVELSNGDFRFPCRLRLAHGRVRIENSCRTTSSVVSSMGRYVCGAGRSFALPVKADVGDGKVLREGAVLHEAGEPRRSQTVMEFTLGGVHSTRKEHL